MYESDIDAYPELTLDHLVSRVFDYYPDEFREYWGLDAEHAPDHLEADKWIRYKHLDRLAKRIAELAKTLVRPGKLPDADLHAPRELREAADRGRRRAPRTH